MTTSRTSQAVETSGSVAASQPSRACGGGALCRQGQVRVPLQSLASTTPSQATRTAPTRTRSLATQRLGKHSSSRFTESSLWHEWTSSTASSRSTMETRSHSLRPSEASTLAVAGAQFPTTLCRPELAGCAAEAGIGATSAQTGLTCRALKSSRHFGEGRSADWKSKWNRSPRRRPSSRRKAATSEQAVRGWCSRRHGDQAVESSVALKPRAQQDRRS